MSSVSGFDPLFDAISQEVRSTKSIFIPNEKPTHTLLSKIARRFHSGTKRRFFSDESPSPFVQPRHEEASIELLHEAKKSPSSLILLSAAENQYGSRLLSAPRHIRQRMVLFVHQPPSWIKLNWREFAAFRDVRAIVCLCSEQAKYFRSVTNARVIEIRHGACLDFFKPPNNRRTSDVHRLLFVGQWLRDFDTLERAFAIIRQEEPRITIDCVVPRRARNAMSLLKLARDPSTYWHADISAEDLLRLYQGATLLFLPLLDATANNAIIEAMSCGLPIVSTNVGGIPDYLPEGAGELCPVGDSLCHANTALAWLRDTNRRVIGRETARATAERHLSWPQIAKTLLGSICEESPGKLSTN